MRFAPFKTFAAKRKGGTEERGERKGISTGRVSRGGGQVTLNKEDIHFFLRDRTRYSHQPLGACTRQMIHIHDLICSSPNLCELGVIFFMFRGEN
jgi:hypothetical protein